MKRKGLTRLFIPLVISGLAAAYATAATKTITFKGSNDESETIALDAEADAQIYVAVTDTGIEITLPVAVDVKCYGDETQDGYCLLAVNEGVTVEPPQPADTDGDGVADSADNCPNNANANQADNDGDGIGNVCDSTPNGPGTPPADADGDGVADSSDNCPNTANTDQADNDNDGIGNVCDSTPNGTTTPGSYCSGASGSNVACGANINLDDMYGANSGYTIELANGTVRAMPFTLKSVTAADSIYFGLELFTDMPSVFLPQAFQVWISSTPGGDPVAGSGCSVAKYAQARGRFVIRQYPSSKCSLPESGGVYYANFSMAQPFGRTYKFFLERQYKF